MIFWYLLGISPSQYQWPVRLDCWILEYLRYALGPPCFFASFFCLQPSPTPTAPTPPANLHMHGCPDDQLAHSGFGTSDHLCWHQFPQCWSRCLGTHIQPEKTQRLQNLHESMMPKRCQARSTCYNETIVKVSNSELFSDSDLRLATILPKHVGHFWEEQSSVIRRFPKDAPSELPGRVPDLP